MHPSATVSHAAVAFRSHAKASDVDTVREIARSSGFFSDQEIEVAVELIEDRLSRGESSDYRFLFADVNGDPIGFASWGPIECTAGSFDLYWIAVHNDHRGGGVGRRLMIEAERLIASEGGRRVYVETSSRPQYEPTRRFYERCGYRTEALLEDFYAPGDGKIVLGKVL